MSKICIITDQHFGARNDSLVFHNYFRNFYQNVFFPYLEKNDISTVILGGDTFDRRKFINFLTLALSKEYFFNECDRRGIKLIINIGNHDVFYKNTNEVNSPELLFMGKYDIVWNEPKTYKFDSLELLIVPWVTADNYDVCMNTIQSTSAQVMLGHLELAGFEMYKGSVIDHGMKTDPFEKFDMVLTGHYHHKSSRSNIHYLGSPYEMTWSDYDDPRGFHVIDTETRELEFIENPLHIFHKVVYNDTDASTVSEATGITDFSTIKDCYIKVVVRSKNNLPLFDAVISELEKNGPADIQVVEDHLNLNLDDTDDIIDEAEDTATMLIKYVNSLDGLSVDRRKLEDMVVGLYNEAIWASENEQ